MSNTTSSQVYAKHLGARISPKKVAPVADLVRGKDVLDAKVILTFDPTKAAEMLLKVIKSAEANALHNNKLNTARLFISELWVGGGPVLKRGRIVAKSRLNPILKRTSNIYVGLSERAVKKAEQKTVSASAKAVDKAPKINRPSKKVIKTKGAN